MVGTTPMEPGMTPPIWPAGWDEISSRGGDSPGTPSNEVVIHGMVVEGVSGEPLHVRIVGPGCRLWARRAVVGSPLQCQGWVVGRPSCNQGARRRRRPCRQACRWGLPLAACARNPKSANLSLRLISQFTKIWYMMCSPHGKQSGHCAGFRGPAAPASASCAR